MTRLIERSGSPQAAITIGIFHPNNIAVFGRICYLRTLGKGNDEAGVAFEETLLKTIQEYFYDARLINRKLLRATADLERIQRQLKTPSQRAIPIMIAPVITESMVENPFHSYNPIEMSLTLHYTVRDELHRKAIEDAINEASFYVELPEEFVLKVGNSISDLPWPPNS